MVVYPILDVSSVLGFIKLWVIIAIACIVLVLVSQPVYHYLRNKFKGKFLRNSFCASWIIFFVVTAILYFGPFLSTPQPILDPELSLTSAELIGFGLQQIIRTILVSLVFSLIALPFILLGSLVNDYLNSRNKKKLKFNFLNVIVASLICTLILLLLIIFVFPWLVTGLFYFLYFY